VNRHQKTRHQGRITDAIKRDKATALQERVVLIWLCNPYLSSSPGSFVLRQYSSRFFWAKNNHFPSWHQLQFLLGRSRSESVLFYADHSYGSKLLRVLEFKSFMNYDSRFCLFAIPNSTNRSNFEILRNLSMTAGRKKDRRP
jgi:hypothetical protein